MARRKGQRLLKLLVANIVVHLFLAANVKGLESRRSASDERWQGSLGEFFSKVDRNRDGEIEPEEAKSFLNDASVGDQDLECMQANVDGADQGDTISETELQRHLQSLLKVWCQCGIRQSQTYPRKHAVQLHSFGL
jgi:hypothetical protein